MPAPWFRCSVNLPPGSCFTGNSRDVGELGASSCADASVALPTNSVNATAKLANRPACAILDCSMKQTSMVVKNWPSADFLSVMYSVHIALVKLKIPWSPAIDENPVSHQNRLIAACQG